MLHFPHPIRFALHNPRPARSPVLVIVLLIASSIIRRKLIEEVEGTSVGSLGFVITVMSVSVDIDAHSVSISFEASRDDAAKGLFMSRSPKDTERTPGAFFPVLPNTSPLFPNHAAHKSTRSAVTI